MKVYELNLNTSHIEDLPFDCAVIPFEGLQDFEFHMGDNNKYNVNRTILLQGDFDVIPNNSDFLVVDIRVRLMSRKMIAILEEDKRVSLNKVDTVILDGSYLDPLFDDKGNLVDNIRTNKDYQFVQVLNFSDVFDRENSIFSYMRSNPEKINAIKKLVLKEPSDGFPAIFRIEEKPNKLFVNEATKQKFEENNIKGYRLWDIYEPPIRPGLNR